VTPLLPSPLPPMSCLHHCRQASLEGPVTTLVSLVPPHCHKGNARPAAPPGYPHFILCKVAAQAQILPSGVLQISRGSAWALEDAICVTELTAGCWSEPAALTQMAPSHGQSTPGPRRNRLLGCSYTALGNRRV